MTTDTKTTTPDGRSFERPVRAQLENTMHLWVVEMWSKQRKIWEPTVGARLSRRDGMDELRAWKRDNPTDDFRLRKYTPAL
jgi:hypothetical protein